MAIGDILTKEFINTAFVILFYATIVILVYLNRKKFEIQSGFIALYRTKIGVNMMTKFGKKHKEFLKILGYIGIGVGFVGMVYISFTLVQNLYNVLFVPGTQSAVAPALPGVRVPGSPIYIPLVIGWLSLFIVTLIHEFSHGIVASAHGLKIKSSGIAFFGPLMAAFVEPDEKDVAKKEDVAQYSLFAAGPFSNILLSIAVGLVIFFMINPVINAVSVPTGFEFEGVMKDYPAATAGLEPGMVLTSVNGVAVVNETVFLEVMGESKPGDSISLTATDGKEYLIVAGAHPDKEGAGFIGVTNIKTHYEPKGQGIFADVGYWLLLEFHKLMFWVLLLSSGIGLVNLLPLGPIDGGRMLNIALERTQGKKRGMAIFGAISIFMLAVLILNFILPIILAVIRKA